MGATTTTTEKIGFSDFADKLEEVKTSTTEVVQQLPIDNEVKTTILISVEDNIKKLLSKLASKEEIGWGIDISPDEFKHLPNSITGVIVHYIIKGIKEDFGLEFEKKPKCLTYNLSKFDKKIAAKKRLLTREQKNELLSKTQMSYYDDKISSGEMTIESAMNSIKEAYEQVKAFQEIGYMLPPEKTKYPYFIDEA
jgi:DNA-binding CsgD family transcriptional regulator